MGMGGLSSAVSCVTEYVPELTIIIFNKSLKEFECKPVVIVLRISKHKPNTISSSTGVTLLCL